MQAKSKIDKKKERHKIINVRLEDTLYDLVSKLAVKKRTSKSEITRKALKYYILEVTTGD